MTWAIETLGFVFLAASMHAAIRRLKPLWNSVLVFAFAALLSGLGLIATLLGLTHASVFLTVTSFSLFLFLAELYLFSFTFVFGSVSAWLLVASLENKPLAKREGEPPRVMVERRLAALCHSGLLFPINEGYSLTPRGRAAAYIGGLLRAFFCHKRHGYGANS
jgi:hypothetical protein